MVSVLKDDDGKVISFIEWQVVDENGIQEENANFIFIRYYWKHESLRGDNSLNEIIKEILKDNRSRYALFVYWNNNRKNRLHKIIKVDYFKRRLDNGKQKE